MTKRERLLLTSWDGATCAGCGAVTECTTWSFRGEHVHHVICLRCEDEGGYLPCPACDYFSSWDDPQHHPNCEGSWKGEAWEKPPYSPVVRAGG